MNVVKRVKSKQGFTLMEMLIVVAIIVILIAIAVPILTSQLGEARDAVDAANLRAAKSVAVIQYYAAGDASFDGKYYDIDNETFTSEKPTAYAKGTAAGGNVIQAEITASGEIKVNWVE